MAQPGELGKVSAPNAALAADLGAQSTGGGLVVFFCPICFEQMPQEETVCPQCRADLVGADARPFAEKLRRALWHRIPEAAIRAAWVLGERREFSAVRELIRLLETTGDGYIAEAAAEALGKIGDRSAIPALEKAKKHGAVRTRHAARLALERIDNAAIHPVTRAKAKDKLGGDERN